MWRNRSGGSRTEPPGNCAKLGRDARLRRELHLPRRFGRRYLLAVLNWSAVRDEVKDFERNIRLVSGGEGLIDALITDVIDLQNATNTGKANAGLSQDLDAIAAYIAFGIRAPISRRSGRSGHLPEVDRRQDPTFPVRRFLPLPRQSLLPTRSNSARLKTGSDPSCRSRSANLGALKLSDSTVMLVKTERAKFRPERQE